MKLLLRKYLTYIFFAALYCVACSKENQPGVNPNNPPDSTIAKPMIDATLVPVGSLSAARAGIQTVIAANKIFLAGGWSDSLHTVVDIYDIATESWSSVSLGVEFKTRSLTIATLGSKVFFAGGGDLVGISQTSIVDIYDATTGSWSTAQLSVVRTGLVAASVGNKVVFAGGAGYTDDGNWADFDAVDIYDNATNKWSTAKLSEARSDLTATVAGDKIYFAGGRIGVSISKTIDIFDASTNTWSTSSLQEPKIFMGSIAVGDKIYWAGGSKYYFASEGFNSDLVEVRNINTGTSTFEHILPRRNLSAARKGDMIIFFTGSPDDNEYIDYSDGYRFEIYNTKTNSWSTGRLNQQVYNASIISINDTVYVAGGFDGRWGFYDKLWRLEF